MDVQSLDTFLTPNAALSVKQRIHHVDEWKTTAFGATRDRSAPTRYKVVFPRHTVSLQR